MRRILIVAGVFVAMASFTFAQQPLEWDWGTTQTNRQIYNGTYNPSTNHCLVNDGNELQIYNADTGVVDAATSISWSAVDPGAFGFGVDCTSDGVIYGVDLSVPTRIARWASETDAPTSFSIASTGQIYRGIAVRGTGTNTVLYIPGGSSDADPYCYILTTTDGLTFSITDTLDDPNGFGKTDVAYYEDATSGTMLWGLQPWGDPTIFPKKYYKDSGGNWVTDSSWSIENPAGTFTYSVGGAVFDDPVGSDNYLITAQYYSTDANYTDTLLMKDFTGHIWFAKPVGADFTYYGNARVDSTNYKVYWFVRNSVTSQGNLGRMTINLPPSVVHDWFML